MWRTIHIDYGPSASQPHEGVKETPMALAKHASAPVTPHSLLGRCAASMYLASVDGQSTFRRFGDLPCVERERYERMAAAALAVAYSEPVILSE